MTAVISVALTTRSLPPRISADQASSTVTRRAWTMGTWLTVTVEAVDRASALRASEAALTGVDEVEARLSTWIDDSELSLLNNAPPGTDFEISRELECDLRAAGHWWRETDGAFDPGLASLVAGWDLRGAGRVPSATELNEARMTAGFAHLALGPGTARRTIAGFGIEEGGFGKGVALRYAAAAARAAGADCVILDFGGHITVDGGCGQRWVGIADPERRDRAPARLAVTAGSVASSGNSERGPSVGGVRHGHLLDPRTGRPAPDWGAVTVLTADPVAADCLSTALFVKGPKDGPEWLRRRPGIEAIFAERRGQSLVLTATSGLEGKLEVFAGSLRFLSRDRKPIRTVLE
jgi:thiamine biosynthesis lipoprotein